MVMSQGMVDFALAVGVVVFRWRLRRGSVLCKGTCAERVSLGRDVRLAVLGLCRVKVLARGLSET